MISLGLSLNPKNLVLLLTVSGGCCKKKRLGGTLYSLVREEDTSSYECDEACVYQSRDQPGIEFCFRPGDSPVECLDDTGEIGINSNLYQFGHRHMDDCVRVRTT